MVLIKPEFDGTGMVSGFYDGPPPTPALYKGRVARLGLGKIESGQYAGSDKLVVVVEIEHGKFKGASIFTQLLLLKQNAWTVNQFLHAMTNGSQKQKDAIEKYFWQIGYDVEETAKSEKLGQQFNWIGSPKFVPIGKPVAFVTGIDGDRVTVEKFVVPGEEADEPADDVAEVLADQVAVAPEPTVTPEPVAAPPVSTPAPTPTPEPAAAPAAVAVADDDDPWG